MTNARTFSLALLLSGLFLAIPVFGQVPSVSDPQSLSVVSGSNVTFSVVASGAAPLSYQWRLAGANVAGATNATLVVSNVQVTAGGAYQVVVTNAFGAVTSAPAFLSVDEHLTFRILELQTNNAIALEHGAVTGDDRGGVVVGPEFVYVTGDSATARFSAANLTGGTGLGLLRDSLCSNLRNERIYALADGNNPLTSGGGTVNALLELDPTSGAPNGTRINLSTNIPFSGFGVGIFSGYDRIVLWDGFNTYGVALPSGQVSHLGFLPGFTRNTAESWAIWGLAEYHANRVNLVYVESFQRIVRRAIGPATASEPIATFNNLSDMASIGFSVSRSRWYFHHEGTSQFRSGDETVGSAKALFTTNAGFPAIFQEPQDQTRFPGDTVTFTTLAGGMAPLSYQWRVNGTNIAGGTNQTLVLNNISPSAMGTYSVVVSNPAGTAVSAGGFLYVVSAPEIFAQPQPAAVIPGTNVSFSVGVLAAPPVSFQWLHNGTNIPNATNALLDIPFATVTHAGTYQVSITNRFGSVVSDLVRLSIIVESPYNFKILSLSNDAVVVEHSELTGDDAGGIAVSSNGVFVTGDGPTFNGATALFPAANLLGGVTLPEVYPALVTDLRTEKVFSLGDGTNRLFTTPATQMNSLIEIDGGTGAQTTNVIHLSQPIPLNFGEVGLFSGYGQIVIHSGSTVYSIAVPSGVVSLLGEMFMPSHQSTESWAFWGLAENFGNSVYLVYVQHSASIVRTRVPDGLTTSVANFLYLSDMASISASVSRGRWYFHHQNGSEFGGTNETVGYASARFSVVATPIVDHFNWAPLPGGQFSGVPFPVTVTARTIDDVVLSNFNGTISLSGFTTVGNQPVLIFPTATASFTNGAWTGEVVVPQPTAAMYLRAADQAGRFGVSGEFDVVTTNDLALQVVPATSAATLYAALTYTLELTNTGPQASSGVFATNILPANVSFVSATPQQGGCSLNGRTVVCDVGTMPAGSGVRIDIVVVPTSLATLTNFTRVVRAAAEGHPENNVATSTIPVSLPTITISDAQTEEGNSGATRGTNVFTVQLNTTSAVPVSVQFATAVGSASNTVDYVNRSGTLTFAPGVTSTNVRVTVVTDVSYEGDEFFFLNFSNAINATLVRTQAVGTILNDDPAPVVVVTNTVVTEGNSGSLAATITVQLSNPASVPIFISYATSNGTAQAGSDYAFRSGTLVFASGVTNQTFTVSITGDTAGESNEFFSINFFGGAPLTVNTQLLVVILNNDPVSVDHFLISNVAPTQQVNVPFYPVVTAQDFNNNTVTNFNGQVSFALGSSESEIGLGSTTWNYPFSVFYEDARLQTIYLASEIGGPRRLTSLSLRVAELPSKPMANWVIRMKHTSLSSYAAGVAWENTGWTVVHQSLLSVSSAGWLTINFTTPFDYNGVNNLMVDFSFDDTSYNFPDGTVFATDRGTLRSAFARCDSCNGDPKLWVTSPGPSAASLVPDVRFGGFGGAPLSPSASGAFTNGVWSGAVRALGPVESTPLIAIDNAQRFGASLPITVLVTDDLSLRIVPSANPAPIGESLIYSLLVSNSGPAISTGVFLTNQLPANAAYVSSTTDRGTLSQVGNRIVADIGTLAGGGTALVTIAVRPNAAGTVVNSAVVRRNEPEPYLANNVQTNSVTIAPRSLSAGLAFVREGQSGTTNITFVVSLSPVSTQTVSVAWIAQSNTVFSEAATAGQDFQPNSGVLVFTPGVTNRTILIPVMGDRQNESDEFFDLVLRNATNAVITESNVLGIIQNDDPLPMVAVSDVSIAEGRDGETPVTLTFTLSEASGFPVRVWFQTEERSANESDFVPTNGFVFFPPGEISAPATVYVRGDAQLEPNELFVVSAYSVENATLAVAQALITILNDEVGAGVLDRFQISQVPSPQTIGRPFSLSITARDGADGIFPLDTTLSLRALSGTNVLTLAPTDSITLTQGLWSGALSLSTPASNVVLMASDGAGRTNQSNPFNVNVADLRITATAPPEALIEFPFDYVLIVSNAAAVPATSVMITNRFSSEVSLLDATVEGGTCFMVDGMVICTFATLTNRQSVAVTLALNPLRGGPLTNVAHVTAFEFDPVPGNNGATNILDITGDADGDGLPDSWESQFGLSSSNPADAQEDPDGDRHTNFQEYVAGTDPSNSASILKVLAEMTESAARLSFETIAGRRYRVERASAPAGPWTMLGSELVGEGDAAVVFDPTIAGQAQRFYRVQVLR